MAEIAHIVAAGDKGPRADKTLPVAERGAFENLILLCVLCHTEIDRAPKEYPAEMVRRWKAQHQQKLKRAFGVRVYPDRASVRSAIEPKLDKDIEYMVMKDYDRRNFYLHTGLTGIFNLNVHNFEQLRMFALTLIGECMLKELAILGNELKLSQALPGYDDALATIEKVQTFAFADKVLQA